MCIWPLHECSVAQSCQTLCDHVDCSPPVSSVHGILQARILKWVVIHSPRWSSCPRDQTQVSWISCISETLGKPYFTRKVCLTQVSLICIEHWNDKQLLSSFLVFFQIPTKRFIFAVFTHALNDICLSPVNWVTFYCRLYFPQISSSPFLWQVSLHSICKNWFSWFSSTFSSLGKI